MDSNAALRNRTHRVQEPEIFPSKKLSHLQTFPHKKSAVFEIFPSKKIQNSNLKVKQSQISNLQCPTLYSRFGPLKWNTCLLISFNPHFQHAVKNHNPRDFATCHLTDPNTPLPRKHKHKHKHPVHKKNHGSTSPLTTASLPPDFHPHLHSHIRFTTSASVALYSSRG